MDKYDPLKQKFNHSEADLIGEVSATPAANTIMDRLKSIYAALTGTLTISGTVTANAGTNLNTSALALEAGNIALVKAVLDKLTFDSITHDLVTNDHVHGEIHDGDTYFYQDAITLGLASQDYLFTTPDTSKWGHWRFSVDFLFVTQLQIFEGSDKTGTTAQTIVNSNRNSVNTPVITLHKGTSGGTTDGTSIFNYAGGLSTGSGANHISSGGGLSGRSEIILKQNTKYIFRVTSSTAANLINVGFDWYEEG